MGKDLIDLAEATRNFQKASRDLYEALDAEKDLKIKFGEKELQVRQQYWEDLQTDKIASAKYNNIVKNETFQEKLDYEAAKLGRKMCETRLDSLKENLYSLKKQLSL